MYPPTGRCLSGSVAVHCQMISPESRSRAATRPLSARKSSLCRCMVIPPRWFVAMGFRNNVPAFGEVLCTQGGYRHHDPGAARAVIREEAALVSVFPDREPGTGRAPGVHDLAVRPGFGTDPFEQIEDQGFDRI